MKPVILFFIVSIFFLNGCISEKKIERRYYTIEIPVDQVTAIPDSISQIDRNLEIEQVVVNKVYEKNQIVNRGNSNEISYYIFNQWAVNPSDAITQAVRSYLEVAGIFKNVSDRFDRSVPDFRLWTYISSLELIEMNKSISTHLGLEFKLIDNSNNKIILSHTADRIKLLDQKDLNIFAREVSTILQEELNIFVRLISDKRNMFPGNPDEN